MKFYDNKRAIDIKLINNDVDWSNDFFADAPPINAKSDWHKVDDVQYCIDQCNDYIHGAGDFFDYAHPETHLEVTEQNFNLVS